MSAVAKFIAHDVAVIPMPIVNAYLVGTAGAWFLVDTGTPGSEKTLKKAIEERFGAGARPVAIVLTHGHPDHAGSALALADEWKVKVYAYPLEHPFLSGRAKYPPYDPTGPGLFSKISPLLPSAPVNLASHLAALDESNPFPGLVGWQAIPTPGHSPGQVSFFRQSDRLLLSGDAITTLDLDTPWGLLSKNQQVCRPPVPATIDWPQAAASVAKLAALKPVWLAPGHGQPMRDTKGGLQKLADNFPMPKHGRYAQNAVQATEHGIAQLPPAPPYHAPEIATSLLVFGLAAGFGSVYPKIQPYLKKKKTASKK